MATGSVGRRHASRASPRHAVHRHPGRQVSAALLLGLPTVLLLGVAGSALLHLGFSPVLTGSMRGTFDPGALVLTRPMPVGDVRPGDIVVFRPPGRTEEYAHRVVTVTPTGAGPVITTKGDANPAPDGWRTPLVGSTVPQVVSSVPALGSLLVAVRHPSRLMLLLASTGITLLLALAATGWLLRPPPTPVVPAPAAPAPPHQHPHDPVVAGQPARALRKGFS